MVSTSPAIVFRQELATLELCEEARETGRELDWVRREICVKLRQGPERTGLDLVRVDAWLFAGPQAVRPHEFPAGSFASFHFEMFLQLARQDVQSQFLAQLPNCTRIIVFAAAKVTGGAGVVAPRKGVFVRGAFLDEEFSLVVEDKDVDRTVPQFTRMDFGTERLADHPVGLVHNVEDFVRILHGPIKTQSWKKESPPVFGGLSAVSF